MTFSRANLTLVSVNSARILCSLDRDRSVVPFGPKTTRVRVIRRRSLCIFPVIAFGAESSYGKQFRMALKRFSARWHSPVLFRFKDSAFQQ